MKVRENLPGKLRWFYLLTALAIVAYWQHTGSAKPCRAQTAFFGPAGTDRSNYTELYVDEDDSTRIIRMFYCVKLSGTTREHFRGFRATVKSDTQEYDLTYGNLDPAVDVCDTHEITEEIMQVRIYSDGNDIEGLIFYGDKGS